MLTKVVAAPEESFCIAVASDSCISGGTDNLCGVTGSWWRTFSSIDIVICCLPYMLQD
jgi:hypothetical protein